VSELLQLPGLESLKRKPNKDVWIFFDVENTQKAHRCGAAAIGTSGIPFDQFDLTPLHERKLLFVVAEKSESSAVMDAIKIASSLPHTPMPNFIQPDQWGTGFEDLPSLAAQKKKLIEVFKLRTPTQRAEIVAIKGQAPPDTKQSDEAIVKAQPTEATKTVEKAPWSSVVKTNRYGVPKNTLANILIIIDLHPAWAGVLRYNQRSMRVIFKKTPPFDSRVKPGDSLSDHHAVTATVWFQNFLDMEVSKKNVIDAMISIARNDIFDPVKDYLDGLEWDGVDRLTSWLTDYCKTSDTEYNKAVGVCWMISAVARVYQPGCQADSMLVLQSTAQGRFKSSLFRELAGEPEFFLDQPGDITNKKEAAINLAGPWIVEQQEMDNMNRSHITAVRAYLTTRQDKYRPPYDRVLEEFPRRVIFGGTVNETTYLSDPLGARRFWTVPVGMIDIKRVVADRDQLWAEAVARYQDGQQWYLTGDLVQLAADVQEDHYQQDPWEEALRDHLDRTVVDYEQRGTVGFTKTGVRLFVMMRELWKVVETPKERQTRVMGARIGNIMVRMGWMRRRVRDGHKRYYAYYPPDDYGKDAEKLVDVEDDELDFGREF